MPSRWRIAWEILGPWRLVFLAVPWLLGFWDSVVLRVWPQASGWLRGPIRLPAWALMLLASAAVLALIDSAVRAVTRRDAEIQRLREGENTRLAAVVRLLRRLEGELRERALTLPDTPRELLSEDLTQELYLRNRVVAELSHVLVPALIHERFSTEWRKEKGRLISPARPLVSSLANDLRQLANHLTEYDLRESEPGR